MIIARSGYILDKLFFIPTTSSWHGWILLKGVNKQTMDLFIILPYPTVY